MSNDETQQRLESELRELRPASTPIDSQSLFYRAGYEAGMSAATSPDLTRQAKENSGKRNLHRFLPALAASLLVAIVAIPASYQAGHQAALELSPQVIPTTLSTQEPADESAAPSSQRSLEVMLADGPYESQREIATLRVQDAANDRVMIDADPFAETKSQLLAKWITPFEGIAESSKLDRQTRSTLTVGHSSLVARSDSGWNWVNFPFAVTSDSDNAITEPTASDPNSPLAATDMNEIAITLEALR